MTMRTGSSRGFTLIELLTVIAIISVLAALIFPLAGTVREQARATDCMTKLHQMWISASVYKADEEVLPASLLGVAELGADSSGRLSSGFPFTGDCGSLPQPCTTYADRMTNGFVYPEQLRNIDQFKCADNPNSNKRFAVVAHYGPKPAFWPTGASWIGDVLATAGCPVDAYGTIDCFVGGPLDKQPKYYYLFDSYDVGPAVDVDGKRILIGGAQVYEKHYATDWTGVRGLGDLTNQLKYKSPPEDKTILSWCTWHAAVARTGSIPVVLMTGTARKVNVRDFVKYGPNFYNQ